MHRIIEFDLDERSFQELSLETLIIKKPDRYIYWIHVYDEPFITYQILTNKLKLPVLFFSEDAPRRESSHFKITTEYLSIHYEYWMLVIPLWKKQHDAVLCLQKTSKTQFLIFSTMG